ncbi:kinectin [Trichonephila clavipes]|nr:kinectin [Trichonephila clavipes]
MASEKMKTRYDARATGHDFREGDKVWSWNPKRRKGLSPKLQTNWEGPYTVLKRLNDIVVRTQKSPHSKPKWRDLLLSRRFQTVPNSPMTPKWSPNLPPTWSPKMMPTWLYRPDFANFSLDRHYNSIRLLADDLINAVRNVSWSKLMLLFFTCHSMELFMMAKSRSTPFMIWLHTTTAFEQDTSLVPSLFLSDLRMS